MLLTKIEVALVQRRTVDNVRRKEGILRIWEGNTRSYLHCVKVVLNGVLSELRFRYDGVHTELQGSRLGFNVCVAPSSVKLSVLEFTEVGVGLELDRS